MEGGDVLKNSFHIPMVLLSPQGVRQHKRAPGMGFRAYFGPGTEYLDEIALQKQVRQEVKN